MNSESILRECSRVAFHPTGFRDWALKTIDELELGKERIGKLLVASGITYDVTENLVYGISIGATLHYGVLEKLMN